MMKLYRKIRQQLLSKNNFGKYLKYAIGEIILVVLGILIALQINNWNQQRTSNKERQKALASLHEELLQNKKLLEASIANNRKTVDSNTFLFSLMGADKEQLESMNIDSLLSTIFVADEFMPTVNAVDNIIQSGRLNLLDDNELSKLLSDWTSIISIYQDRDNTLDDWTYNHTITYLNKYISFRQVDLYGDYKWAGKSRLKKDYYSLFQEIEFENIIESQVFFTYVCLTRLNEAYTILEKLIEKTTPISQ